MLSQFKKEMGAELKRTFLHYKDFTFYFCHGVSMERKQKPTATLLNLFPPGVMSSQIKRPSNSYTQNQMNMVQKNSKQVLLNMP